MRIKMISLACVLFSTTLLAWNYYGFGYPIIALSILIVPVLWTGNLVLRVRWISSLLLFILFIMSGVGLYFRLPSLWVLLCWVAAIMAWDFIYFSYRMEEAPKVENAKQIERRHLIWLLSALCLGLLFAVLVLYIEITLSFWIVVILSILLVWGIGRGIKVFKDSGF